MTPAKAEAMVNEENEGVDHDCTVSFLLKTIVILMVTHVQCELTT